MIPLFERAKKVHALDRAATVTGSNVSIHNHKYNTTSHMDSSVSEINNNTLHSQRNMPEKDVEIFNPQHIDQSECLRILPLNIGYMSRRVLSASSAV
jgi:hypothetical protein